MIAVLGAGGYVGAGLCGAVADAGEGARFRLVEHRTPLPPVPGADVVRADLTRAGAVREVVAGCDVVIDLMSDIQGRHGWRGGGPGDAPGEADVEVVQALIAGTESGASLVYVSTAALSVPAAGASTYVTHKGIAEVLVLEAATAGSLAAGCSLRLPSLYGVSRGQRPLGRGAVAAMIRDAVEHGRLSVWGPGNNLRSWLHVHDAARAVLAAADAVDRLSGRAWDVGTLDPEPLQAMVSRVALACEQTTGRAPVVEHLPPPSHASPHDLADSACETQPFMAATGWTPRWEPTTGVAQMLERYLETREVEETR